MDITKYIKRCQQLVNATIKKRLPSKRIKPQELTQAMNYSALAGGKRLRSAFVFATGEALGAKQTILSEVSAAVEMVHTYSLIHDDLPALDNDDLRRGHPTCHKVYGEATAILAGDALQTLAFEVLSQVDTKKVAPIMVLKMIQTLSQAIGYAGMVGGESMDIQMVNKKVSAKEVELMFNLKTACLIRASILLGAYAANCRSKKVIDNLGKFGEYLGIAFQIHDDIIGIESDTQLLGKKQGNDLEMNKPAYPVVAGMKQAKLRRKIIYQKALSYLDKAGIKSDILKALAAFNVERNY